MSLSDMFKQQQAAAAPQEAFVANVEQGATQGQVPPPPGVGTGTVSRPPLNPHTPPLMQGQTPGMTPAINPPPVQAPPGYLQCQWCQCLVPVREMAAHQEVCPQNPNKAAPPVVTKGDKPGEMCPDCGKGPYKRLGRHQLHCKGVRPPTDVAPHPEPGNFMPPATEPSPPPAATSPFIPPGHPLGVPASAPVNMHITPTIQATEQFIQQNVTPTVPVEMSPEAAAEHEAELEVLKNQPPTTPRLEIPGGMQIPPIAPTPKKTTVIFDAYFVTPIAAGEEEVYPLAKWVNKFEYKLEPGDSYSQNLNIACAEWLVSNPFPSCLLVDSDSREGRALKSLLIQHADIVIQGVGR